MIGEGFGDHSARRFRRLRFRGAHSDVAEELDPPFGDDLAGDLVHGAENAAYSSRCGLIRHRTIGDSEMGFLDKAISLYLEESGTSYLIDPPPANYHATHSAC